jgi:hypothetical protein
MTFGSNDFDVREVQRINLDRLGETELADTNNDSKAKDFVVNVKSLVKSINQTEIEGSQMAEKRLSFKVSKNTSIRDSIMEEDRMVNNTCPQMKIASNPLYSSICETKLVNSPMLEQVESFDPQIQVIKKSLDMGEEGDDATRF